MRHTLGSAAATVAALGLMAACTVHQTEIPPLAGPSELATSLQITATPDSIRQDGASQSSIQVLVRDANARPVSGRSLRLDMAVNGVTQDFGTLSARTVITGSDGKASAVYTAPAAPPAGSTSTGNRVSILVTPIGTNADVTSPLTGPASLDQMVDILLTVPGVIIGPAQFSPAFTFTPSTPTQGQSVVFDASSTTNPTNASLTYAWTFGDGGTGTGRTATYTYDRSGTFSTTLTVTDSQGRAASTTKAVSVSAGTAPTIDFTFSPRDPAVNQTITFVATAQSTVAGHSIVSYDWDFGSGTPQSGRTVTKSYDIAGAYTVTLTVTDDLGLTRSTVKVVTVSNTVAPSVRFTVSPTEAVANQPVTFDASGSSASVGSTITDYAWSFGDTTQIIHSTTPVVQHTYAVASDGDYTVSLTVTDSNGRTATASTTLGVTGVGTLPGPRFTFSPSPAAVRQVVTFDTTGTTTGAAPCGGVISNYQWTFGDTPTIESTASPTITHTYQATGTFTVTLTVTTSVGACQASITHDIVVQ